MPLIVIFSLLAFLALGGLFGGYVLIIDRSGESLGLPAELIDKIPLVKNYLLLALFILLMFGLVPIIVIFGLIAFDRNKQRLHSISTYHWSWRSARITSLTLIGWIIIQGFTIGFQHPIQLAYGICGLMLYGLLSMKGVRQIYRFKEA